MRLLFLLVVTALVASCGMAAGTETIMPMQALLHDHAVVRMEDDVMDLVESKEEEAAAAAVAYPRRRALYDGGYINYNTLSPSKLGCYGQCGARGQPYTGPGCHSYYQCRG